MKKLLVSLLLWISAAALFAQIQRVEADAFERQLILNQGQQLIDVRTPQEFAKYRIKSARNMDYRDPGFKKTIERLDKTKPVFVYCLSGGRSNAALAVFRTAGFKTVYELKDGLNAWIKKGYPVDQDLSGKGELPVNEYDAFVAQKGYVLVDFYAPWCGPCRKMLPMVEGLAKDNTGKFKLLTIDYDQNRVLANEKHITGVPRLIVFKDGKKVWEKTGEASREELMKILGL